MQRRAARHGKPGRFRPSSWPKHARRRQRGAGAPWRDGDMWEYRRAARAAMPLDHATKSRSADWPVIVAVTIAPSG